MCIMIGLYEVIRAKYKFGIVLSSVIYGNVFVQILYQELRIFWLITDHLKEYVKYRLLPNFGGKYKISYVDRLYTSQNDLIEK